MEKQVESKEEDPSKDDKSEKTKAAPVKIPQVVFTPDLNTNTTTLKLTYKEIHDWIFAAILNRLPMLTVLELVNIKSLIRTENHTHVKIHSKALQSLTMDNSSTELLTFMVLANLQHFRINTSSLKENEALDDFLTECNNLIKLEIKAINCDLMDFFTGSEFPFRLKHLQLSSTVSLKKKSYSNEKEAVKFLSTHCTPLNILELRAPLPDAVVEYALKTFRVQRVVTMRLDLLPSDEDFFRPAKGKKPKRSVKQLTLEGPYKNPLQIQGIFKLYPAIQALKISDTFNHVSFSIVTEILYLVSGLCPLLAELSIPRLPLLANCQNMKFKNLVILKLEYFNTVADLTSMFKISPHLRTLFLKLLRKQSSQELVKELLSYNIQNLDITADPHECVEFYNHIKDMEPGKLVMLDIRAEDFNYCRTYQFCYRDLNYAKGSRDEAASKLFHDHSDYLMTELMKSVGEAQSSDSAVIDYALNTFDIQ